MPGASDAAYIEGGRSAKVSSPVSSTSEIRVGANGDGTLSITNGGNLLTTGQLSLSRNTGAFANLTGTLNMDGGTLSVGNLVVGFTSGTGVRTGVFNLHSGTFISTNGVVIGGVGATGQMNIYGDKTAFSCAGRFLVSSNAGSSVKWDFAGGSNLTTIAGVGDFRMYSGNTYTVDFANFSGKATNYVIKLIDASVSAGNIDVTNRFTFVNTNGFSNIRMSLADANKDLVLNFTAIPEPATLGLFVVSGTALLCFRRHMMR